MFFSDFREIWRSNRLARGVQLTYVPQQRASVETFLREMKSRKISKHEMKLIAKNGIKNPSSVIN